MTLNTSSNTSLKFITVIFFFNHTHKYTHHPTPKRLRLTRAGERHNKTLRDFYLIIKSKFRNFMIFICFSWFVSREKFFFFLIKFLYELTSKVRNRRNKISPEKQFFIPVTLYWLSIILYVPSYKYF